MTDSPDAVVLTILGYPLGALEFAGTGLYLVSVWLMTRRHVLTWPIGMASVLLFLVLFYRLRLYSDALEQIYYLGASAYGWWYWATTEPEDSVIADVDFSPAPIAVAWLFATVALSVALAAVMSRIHVWLPQAFPEPAAYPVADAGTTVASLVAMWLMARKHVESWLYWIAVDVVAVWLYLANGVRFVALLYGILLVLAFRGWIRWGQAASRADPAARANPVLGSPA